MDFTSCKVFKEELDFPVVDVSITIILFTPFLYRWGFGINQASLNIVLIGDGSFSKRSNPTRSCSLFLVIESLAGSLWTLPYRLYHANFSLRIRWVNCFSLQLPKKKFISSRIRTSSQLWLQFSKNKSTPAPIQSIWLLTDEIIKNYVSCRPKWWVDLATSGVWAAYNWPLEVAGSRWIFNRYQ